MLLSLSAGQNRLEGVGQVPLGQGSFSMQLCPLTSLPLENSLFSRHLAACIASKFFFLGGEGILKEGGKPDLQAESQDRTSHGLGVGVREPQAMPGWAVHRTTCRAVYLNYVGGGASQGPKR